MKFKNTTHNNILLMFLVFIFLIFIQKNNIFRKLYNIQGNNLEKRLVQVYGYCGKHSYGFLNEINNKYILKENPVIVDYIIQPSSNWLIHDTSKKMSKKANIFLNYKKNLELKFILKDNLFVSEKNMQGSSGIEEINFDITEPIKINHVIQIFKVVDNNKKIIFEKKIDILIEDQKNIIINHKTDLIDSRWENIYISLINLDKKSLQKINNIKLNLKNKFQILDDDIIFKKENCFYTK